MLILSFLEVNDLTTLSLKIMEVWKMIVVVKETCKCRCRDLFSTSMIIEKDGGRLWHLEYVYIHITYHICIYIFFFI